MTYVDPVDEELTAHWLRLGFGPRKVLAKLQLAYGKSELSEEVVRGLEDEWQRNRSAISIVYRSLGDRPWRRLTLSSL